MPRKSKTFEDYVEQFRADGLSRRVLKNDQYNTVSIGQTAMAYGYIKSNIKACMAIRLVSAEIGLDLTKGHVSGMGVTPETAALGWEALSKHSIFSVVNEKSGRYFISSSKSPWLRRTVMYFWLKNIHTYNKANTFFGNAKIIEDVEKYGVDSFKLNIIQEIQPHISNISIIELENSLEKEAGDKLYFNKNAGLRQQTILGDFIHYHPELEEVNRRWCHIRDHYFMCKDNYKLLKGRHNKEAREKIKPILDAAIKEYNEIHLTQSHIRENLIKMHMQGKNNE